MSNNTPRHTRRPPLAEIDSWELWQAWKRGERKMARPWIGLLSGFCLVLAAMYSFFFFSTSLNNDTIAQVGLTLILAGFLYYLWRRISPRRDFSLAVVGLVTAVSGAAFLLWLLAYGFSGWNPMVAVLGTLVLGLLGLGVSLPSLNEIARRQEGDNVEL
jgi:hypothetical protein